MTKIDYFNINPDVKPEESLKDKFQREREEWTEKIETMSAKMKQIFDIPLLMTDLYTERQRALQAMSDASINGRSMMGSEASYYHNM